MITVVSQAWSKDEGDSADAYIAMPAAFLDFMKQQPGSWGVD